MDGACPSRRLGAGRRASLEAALLAALGLLLGCHHDGAQPPALPVESDTAAYANGGGCRTTGIAPGQFDQILLIDPHWTAIEAPRAIDSTPVVVHGVAHQPHGDTGGDYPFDHLSSDVTVELELDASDSARYATGNLRGDPRLSLEWESALFPEWAWPGEGDRMVARGRFIFDCGHPAATPGTCSTSTLHKCLNDADCEPPVCPSCGDVERCVAPHFGYTSELHPPDAVATLREGRGAIVSADVGAQAVPATRADLYVSANGGGAGDRCVLAYHALDKLLTEVNCFPLAQPIAQPGASDFDFQVPLPPRPPGAQPLWRLEQRDPSLTAPARLEVVAHGDAVPPFLDVRVKLTAPAANGLPAQGFAGTLFAGWTAAAQPLVHLRLTLDSVVIHNPLKPLVPVVREAKSWALQLAVNGQWQRLAGLEEVRAGAAIPQGLRYEQWVPEGGALQLIADGTSRACVDTLFGQALSVVLPQLGSANAISCLTTTPADPGRVLENHAAPDFGAGAHESLSTGGDGGSCSVTTSQPCLTRNDCPNGEECGTQGGAYSLRYHIERLP